MAQSDDFDRLEFGTGVHFMVSEGEKGPQASTVRIVNQPGSSDDIGATEGTAAEVASPAGWR